MANTRRGTSVIVRSARARIKGLGEPWPVDRYFMPVANTQFRFPLFSSYPAWCRRETTSFILRLLGKALVSIFRFFLFHNNACRLFTKMSQLACALECATVERVFCEISVTIDKIAKLIFFADLKTAHVDVNYDRVSHTCNDVHSYALFFFFLIAIWDYNRNSKTCD